VIAEIDTQPAEALIAQDQAQIAEDEVGIWKAEADLARGRALFSSGLLPKQQVEDLEWTLNAARARLAKSQSDLQAAKVTLSYCQITAPISGIVASVTTQEGETVAASFTTPTFVTIIDHHALELVAMVDEADIAAVSPGQEVRFSVESYASRDLQGKVLRINPTATIVSGVVNYEVVIAIRSDFSFLKPDMTANVAIRTMERKAVVVPASAVRGTGEDRYVYIQGPRGPVRREVSIGARQGELTEVRKGVSAGDMVIVGTVPEEEKRGRQ
jgi:macrolide-specific efflux system membrane fusion protein